VDSFLNKTHYNFLINLRKKLLIHHTRKFIFCDDVKSIKILLSKLKVDTGVIGAAAIFR
tara:strand:+ start:169 stop:345 length:177 start_codon:yes stop_codon:yes gene_type:complete